MYAEEQCGVCDGGVDLWGRDDFVAEVGEECLVGGGEDWFLVGAFYGGVGNGFCCCEKQLVC